jgi:hypothetical protein
MSHSTVVEQNKFSPGEIVIKGGGAGWAGWEVSLNGKTALRLSGENFYMTGKPQAGMWVPKSGSTSKLLIYKANNPKKVFRVDYRGLDSTEGKPAWHYNKTSGFAKIRELSVADHAVTPTAAFTGKVITLFRWGGRALFLVGAGMSVYDIYHAEDKAREITRQVGGWSGAIAGGRACFPVGARFGAGAMTVAGQFGPQVTTPEEVVTVPAGAVIGGAIASLGCGVAGWFGGTKVTETVYDCTFSKLEKEEYVICAQDSPGVIR